MASVTVAIPDLISGFIVNSLEWDISPGSYLDLGASLSVDGNTQLFLGRVRLPRSTSQSEIAIRLAANQTV